MIFRDVGVFKLRVLADIRENHRWHELEDGKEGVREGGRRKRRNRGRGLGKPKTSARSVLQVRVDHGDANRLPNTFHEAIATIAQQKMQDRTQLVVLSGTVRRSRLTRDLRTQPRNYD